MQPKGTMGAEGVEAEESRIESFLSEVVALLESQSFQVKLEENSQSEAGVVYLEVFDPGGRGLGCIALTQRPEGTELPELSNRLPELVLRCEDDRHLDPLLRWVLHVRKRQKSGDE